MYVQFPSINKSKKDEFLKEPRGLCWNHDKTLIILCDSGNNRLLVLKPKFEKSSTYLNFDFEYTSIISDLPAPSHLPNKSLLNELNKSNTINYPASVCTSPIDGEVFVCDTFNNRLVCLSKDLNSLERIYANGFKNPFNVCVWKDRVIVADTYNNRVLLLSLNSGMCEKVIPDNKGAESDQQSDDDSVDERYAKKKRVGSVSTESTSTNSSTSSSDESGSASTGLGSRLKPCGNFHRPYGLYVDANDRLFVLDWYNTDTGSNHEETIRLSGRIHVYDLENHCQLLSYTLASYKLHLPNTMIVLKNGDCIVCNVRHLTLFTKNPSKPYSKYNKLKFKTCRNYSDDDETI